MNNLIRPLIALLVAAGSVISSVVQARARVAAARAPFEPPQPTARQVFGALTATGEDFINACKLGGIPESEAKTMWGQQMHVGAAATLRETISTAGTAAKAAPAAPSKRVPSGLENLLGKTSTPPPYGTRDRSPYG